MILSIAFSALILEISKTIVLLSIFSDEKIKFPSMGTVAFSLAICDSFSFSSSLVFFRPFFRFSFQHVSQIEGPCFTKTTSSLVAFTNFSLGCTGNCSTKMISLSSLSFIFCFFESGTRGGGGGIILCFGKRQFFFSFYTSLLFFSPVDALGYFYWLIRVQSIVSGPDVSSIYTSLL